MRLFSSFKVKTRNGTVAFFRIRPVFEKHSGIIRVDNLKFHLSDVKSVVSSKEDIFVNLVDVPLAKPDGAKLNDFLSQIGSEGDYL